MSTDKKMLINIIKILQKYLSIINNLFVLLLYPYFIIIYEKQEKMTGSSQRKELQAIN